jgi:ammonia channel protein AmtB
LNPLQLVLLGLVAGAAAGLAVLTASAFFVPFARARRAALAGLIGGTIGFRGRSTTMSKTWQEWPNRWALLPWWRRAPRPCARR